MRLSILDSVDFRYKLDRADKDRGAATRCEVFYTTLDSGKPADVRHSWCLVVFCAIGFTIRMLSEYQVRWNGRVHGKK